MSAELANLMLWLSDPVRYAQYQDNPDAVLGRFKLTNGDRTALVSRKSGWIRAQAKLTEDIVGFNAEHPFVISANEGMEIEVDLEIEIHNEAHDMIADHGPGTIVVAENGQLYRVIAQPR